jgi:hypothetical protein
MTYRGLSQMEEMHKELLFIFVFLSIVPMPAWLLINALFKNNPDAFVLLMVPSLFFAMGWKYDKAKYSFGKVILLASMVAIFIDMSALVGFVLLPKLILGHSLLKDIVLSFLLVYCLILIVFSLGWKTIK